MDLSTRYLGLALRNPLVASASPLSNTLDGVRRLADAGVGAIVLYSLFEEQLRQEAERNARLADAGTDSFAESLSYFPSGADSDPGPSRYLSLLERAAAAVDVPVIGSLNGVTPGGWTSYARAIQDAGAAAIELNIYYIPGDPRITGREVEERHIDILHRVKDVVTVPVAVKLSPHFSSTGEIALRLDEAGADGLVLFNRFLQPDIDPETLAVVPAVDLSSPAEARLPRTWISILRGQVRACLAATTGVEGPADVVKYLLAGADVVMTASALIRHGPRHAAVLLDGLSAWMARKGFASVADLRGLLAVPTGADQAAYERAGYFRALRAANSEESRLSAAGSLCRVRRYRLLGGAAPPVRTLRLLAAYRSPEWWQERLMRPNSCPDTGSAGKAGVVIGLEAAALTRRMAALSDEPGRAADAAGGLSFPDVPRLELDQLRALLRANALVASELSLPVVLRQIVAASRSLLGARYAALGVLGCDGGLEQFVHVGMDDELVKKVGDLPAGYPPGHPPMTSVLGIPVRIGEEVFGNLYLTERAGGGEFTADEEELAIAIAAAGGAAIANARRFNESEQRRRWLAASSELTPLLLAAGATKSHMLITQHAAAAAEADFATLAVPHSAGQMIVKGVCGALATHLMDRTAPLADSLAGQVMLTGQPCVVADGDREAAAALGASAGPLMFVPLAADEHIRGVLMLGQLVTGPGFTETELDMAVSFARHAAVALELAQARLDQIALAQVEDHDRIASDLHDHVVQELFALGMRLQSHAARLEGANAEQVSGFADTLDQVIARVRTSIFGLRPPRYDPGALPARLVGIIEEHAPQLGFTADVRFAGPLELNTNMALADDILAVTREALSNCARHAHATAVGISLALHDGLITLDIADNGRGRGTTTRSSGLTSMRHRAERNGGTFQLTTPGSGGTHLTWTARGGAPDRPA